MQSHSDEISFRFSTSKVAVLLGADPVRAASELRESLLFEIKLANASLPREQRRNASKLYNPMKLSEMSGIADIVDWTTYVNNVLTEDLLQVTKLLKLFLTEWS